MGRAGDSEVQSHPQKSQASLIHDAMPLETELKIPTPMYDLCVWSHPCVTYVCGIGYLLDFNPKWWGKLGRQMNKYAWSHADS